jgi:hypothetical protein
MYMYDKYNEVETEGAINNCQSRDTDNIEHKTQNEDKQQNTVIQKIKRYEQCGPHKKRW